MGGQACVFYGAAEFSRDTDFAFLADTANLARLRKALAELEARVIAVPLVFQTLAETHNGPDARRFPIRFVIAPRPCSSEEDPA